MGAVKHAVRVVSDGGFAMPVRRQPPLVVGCEHFRLERQGALLSPKTLVYYDETVLPFLRWLEAESIRRFHEVDVGRVRTYRAYLATKMGKWGRPLAPKTILEYHRPILCFLRWARRDGYAVDGRNLELTAPRVPDKEPTVYHIAQVRRILAACKPAVPTEDLVVRILVGSGLRREELCGLAVVGPDGLSDVMTDSLGSGRVELRVRWNAGAEGRKSRRVPITPKLAAAIKRYEARHRHETDLPQLLINEAGRPYQGPGIKAMMDRLTERSGESMPMRSSTRSQLWRQRWAGTSSTFARRWVTRTAVLAFFHLLDSCPAVLPILHDYLARIRNRQDVQSGPRAYKQEQGDHPRYCRMSYLGPNVPAIKPTKTGTRAKATTRATAPEILTSVGPGVRLEERKEAIHASRPVISW